MPTARITAKVDGGREVLFRLAEVSHVLIANLTPGVLERLGIGYGDLSARNPRIIVVEMPAFGPDGPGRQPELDENIAAWTRQSGKHELAARLQAAGVPAAPVNNGADVAADPVLLATGFIRPMVHPEAGRHDYPSLSYQLDRTPGGISSPAPCFGEHNDLILRDIIGLSDAEVVTLVTAGAVTDRPSAAPSPHAYPLQRRERDDRHSA